MAFKKICDDQTDFFFMYNLKSQELNLDNYFARKLCGRASDFTFARGIFQDLEPTGRKKPILGQKKAANNFFDADHHFEPHEIGLQNCDQQTDVPKRGL